VRVEGTGSYGAGLTCYLLDQHVTVVEVDRPDRRTRRQRGKSDPITPRPLPVLSWPIRSPHRPSDATASWRPSACLGRCGAVPPETRTAAINQLKGLLVTAPTPLREDLDQLSVAALAATCARLRPDEAALADPVQAMKAALRVVACRIHQLDEEIGLAAEAARDHRRPCWAAADHRRRQPPSGRRPVLCSTSSLIRAADLDIVTRLSHWGLNSSGGVRMEGQSVLLAQVEVARDDLRSVQRLLTADETWRSERLTAEFHEAVRSRLRDYFIERHLDLEGVMEDVAAGKPLDQCWGRLKTIRTQTERTLRESLAFLAGLLVRRAGLDGGYCAVVDALLGELAAVTPPEISWAKGVILDAGDSFTPLSSIIRTRFPEFTVWALPVAGHEVGHVILQELRKLTPDARAHTYPLVELAAKHSEAYARTGQKPPRARRARTQMKLLGDTFVRELFGDFFAVYALGASYACSALLVRFEPWRADLPGSHHPPQVERAHLILRTLREVHGGYGNVADILDNTWRELLASCGVAPVAKDTADRLNDLATAFLTTAQRHLSKACYLEQNASSLVEPLQKGRVNLDAAASEYSIREWDDPDKLAKVADSTMKLCYRIAGVSTLGSEHK
jgi:hypothetical protein